MAVRVEAMRESDRARNDSDKVSGRKMRSAPALASSWNRNYHYGWHRNWTRNRYWGRMGA